MSFWESEEALRANDQAIPSVRSKAAETADGVVAGVEECEVLVNEAPSAGPLGSVTDTVGGAARPVSGVTDTGSGATGNLLGGGEKKS